MSGTNAPINAATVAEHLLAVIEDISTAGVASNPTGAVPCTTKLCSEADAVSYHVISAYTTALDIAIRAGYDSRICGTGGSRRPFCLSHMANLKNDSSISDADLAARLVKSAADADAASKRLDTAAANSSPPLSAQGLTDIKKGSTGTGKLAAMTVEFAAAAAAAATATAATAAAAGRSLQDMQTATNSQLAAVVGLQQQYTVLKSPQAENSQQVKTLKAEVQQQQAVMASLQQAEQAYAREYLDRKAGPSTTGFGLGSSQNWSITMFFIAYALCTVAVLGVAVRYSYDDQKIKMAASAIMISVIGALVIMRALIYAG